MIALESNTVESGLITIPFNDLKRQNTALRAELRAAADSVLDSGWYILGSQCAQFEAEFAGYCGVTHAVGVGNGTDALEIALRACGVGPGDRVATVANAGGYSSTAIRLVGAEPVYVDIDSRTMLMDLELAKRAIGTGVKAVIATHLYGRMIDMPALMELSKPNGVTVIEDCAQAHGAQIEGVRCGAFGDAGCFSFYPTKNLGALGDAGAVITNDAGLAGRLRQLRQYGWSQRYYSVVEGGRNSRLDELQAAVLRVKLPLLDQWNERRRSIVRAYNEALRGSAAVLPGDCGEADAGHLYVIRIADRERVRTALHEAGAGTAVHYPVVDSGAGDPLPESRKACREVLSLPCFPELTDQEVSLVAETVCEVLKR